MRANGQRKRKKLGHSRANTRERKLTISKLADLCASALAGLAGFARTALLFARALFKRHADPRQSQSHQRIANQNQKRQHRPLPQCSKSLCARFVVKPQAAGPLIAPNDEFAATDRCSRLDGKAENAKLHAMLQHNSARAGRRAHLAHAAVMGMHAFCCGLPALAMLAAAVSGATSGIALLSDSFAKMHDFLHAHEVWILIVSAALVISGGWLEVSSRRHHRHGFPWLFAFSVLCFLANVTIIVLHRAT